MTRILSSLVALFLLAGAVSAQGTERYLPAGSQIVLQVDHPEKTKAALDKTAFGQMWNGETGKFFVSLYRYAVEAGEIAARQYNLPEEDIALAKDGLKLVERILGNGITLGVEVSNVLPPQAQAVLVLENLGVGETNLPRLIAKVLERAGGLQSREEKVGTRTIQYFELPVGQVGWWNQDGHAVIYLGTDSAAAYARKIDDNKTGLANHASYQRLKAMGEFPVAARALVDVPLLVKLAGSLSPEVGQVTQELGLKNLSSVLWVTGYDGRAVRSVSEIEITGPRKGLLAFYSEKKIKLADLPPLPDDLGGFSASNFNLNLLYGGLMTIAEGVAKVYAPDQIETVKEGIKAIEGLFGVSFSTDIFGSFDDLTIQYSSPSEGFSLGGVYLLKVKDEARLKKALKTVLQALPQIPGVTGGLKVRNYRGVEVFEMHTNSPGNFTVPSLAIHKGFLCYAGYPQSVRGFILRMDGELPRWKASDDITKALGAFPKEFTSVSIGDSRGAMRLVLGILPPLLAGGNGFVDKLPGLQPFDVSLVPHPQEATRMLFPTVSVTTDDGKKIRTDTRSSW